MKHNKDGLSIPSLFAIAAIVPLALFTGLSRASTNVSPVSANTASSDSGHYAPETVEMRISHLHSVLRITPDQEHKWKKVAKVMRNNAEELDDLMKDRSENAARMTAVDDLESYERISEAHEKGMERLIPAFDSLYDDLSDSQKRAADMEFRKHEHHSMK